MGQAFENDLHNKRTRLALRELAPFARNVGNQKAATGTVSSGTHHLACDPGPAS